jgi:CHAT domain-containing protein
VRARHSDATRALLRRILLAATLGALAGCASAVFVANQMAARSQLDAADRADLDAGNLAAIRARYASRPPDTLPLVELALFCDVLLKYQELGRASDCLATMQARIDADPAAQSGAIARGLHGKKALLALALGEPAVAAGLVQSDETEGGRYVFALASIRTGKAEAARPIAAAMRRAFEPTPVYYAAALYAALGDFATSRAVLEDPARRLLADYGLSGHTDILGGTVGAAPFRLDPFDEFGFGLFGNVTLAPAANAYVEYLAALDLLRTGATAEAQQRLDVLLAWPNIAAFRDVYWRALTDRAEIAERAGDAAMAERLLRQAIEVIEEIRGSIGAEAARIAVVADKDAPYRRLVDLLTRRGALREAVVYAERARSRALVELLAARYTFGPGGPGSAANRLVDEYDASSGALALAAAAAPGEQASRRARLAEVRRELLADAPDVADLVTVAPVDLAAVQARLGEEEAALVFFPGEPRWHVFTLTRTTLSAHDIAPVDAEVLALRRGLAQSETGWQAPAASLYRDAVLPALAGVQARSLVIVPSGLLNYVPFAALGEGGTFLIDRYDLRMLPNLGLLDRPMPAARGGAALVIGDPLHDNPEYALPGAEREARDVAALLPGATLLLGAQATIARFSEDAAGASLIHFAGHGVFDAAHPLDSALLFAGPGGRVDPLPARRLYGMRIAARLAFLSACETGVNALAGGEDLMGMERGFFFAGAGTVIASLWQVQDRATAMLAHEFYTALARGATPARALQSASIAVRGQFAHPLIWSAFVLASAGAP